MLTTLRDVLDKAYRGRYAVPAFNGTEDIQIRTILETSESLRAPVIVMGYTMDLDRDGGNGWFYLPGLVRAVAEHHDIPIVLHLDHTSELDTIKKAVDHGFTSVMIDGSALPLEENIELSRKAVELARPHGVSVEAELGHVGGMTLDDNDHSEGLLTDPQELDIFGARTGIDALAVSIGTAHGVYRAAPTLNIERLKELDAASLVPLVLHGGSGTPDDQVREAVSCGICKMNVFADQRIAMARGLREFAATNERVDPLPDDMFKAVRRQLAQVIEEKIKLLAADGKA